MLPAGHIAAQHAYRLGQRAHLDVDAAVEAEVVHGAAPVAAEHARGVGVVDHHGGLVPLGDLADAGQRGDVAVHAEDAVGDDQDVLVGALRAARRAGFAQDLLEAVHVAVREDRPRGLREAYAVDDRGVVQLVADDQVALPGDGRDDAAVGGEARLEGERRLHVFEDRQATLQLLVQLHGAGDGAHGTRPDAQVAGGPERRLDEVGVRGEAEVVVRGEADDGAAVHDRARRLRAAHDAQRAVEGLRLQVGDLIAQVGQGVGSVGRRAHRAHPSCGSRTTLPACPAATRSNARW